MGQFTFNVRACHFFFVYLQRRWKCYGTSARVKFNKQEEYGEGRGICQCLTTGRSGYQSLSLATEVAEAAKVFQITLTCAKALARRDHSGVLHWSLLSQLQAGLCVQQLLLFNSNIKFFPWFYDKALIQALQSCSYSFNPFHPPSILQNNLAEKESRSYDARAQFSSNWHLWEMDQSQDMTKSLAGVNILIYLKNTSSQDKTVSPHPHAA